MWLNPTTHLANQAKNALDFARLEHVEEEARRMSVLAAVADRGGTVTGAEYREIRREAGYTPRGGGGYKQGRHALLTRDTVADAWNLTSYGRAVLANQRSDMPG
jgi:hypothetical protein